MEQLLFQKGILLLCCHVHGVSVEPQQRLPIEMEIFTFGLDKRTVLNLFFYFLFKVLLVLIGDNDLLGNSILVHVQRSVFQNFLDLFSLWLFTLKVVLKWFFFIISYQTKLEFVCCIWPNFDLQPQNQNFVGIKLSSFQILSISMNQTISVYSIQFRTILGCTHYLRKVPFFL